MANPKAYQNGIATQFKQRLDVELAEKPIPVRLPVDVDAVVRQLPNRSAWLRRVITAAAQQELMPPQKETRRSAKSSKLATFRKFNLSAGQRLVINGHACTMKGWIGEGGDEIEVRFDEKVAIAGKRPVLNARVKASEVESFAVES
jgi:hypothetical protein